MENTQPRGKVTRRLAVISAAVIAVVFAIPLLGLASNNIGNLGTNTPSPTPSSTTSATPKPTPSAEGCPAAYKQKADPHTGGKVITANAEAFDKAFAVGTTGTIDDKARTFLLQQSGYYVNALAVYAYDFGIYPDSNKWQPLYKDNCLSPEGQKLHVKLEGVLESRGVKMALEPAPANGYNSGISNGIYGVETSQGVSGDRTAIKVTLPNGTVFWIMKRCGNPVYPGKPHLPTIPSTFVPPAPPVVPPPPSSCPPGNEIPRCAPKSSNPGDYTYPSGKPRVPTVTTPAERTPPPVVTHQTGGGGVVDTPTNQPGSETGVTAPGPGVAPPPPVRTPPPNEGTGSGSDPTVPPTAPPGDPGGF